jgi:hypothetical protein
MSETNVSPAIAQELIRYLEIQEQVRQLEEEKAAIKLRLEKSLESYAEPFWYPTVNNQPLKIRVKHDTEITYNEEMLRQRLGPQYPLILKVDPVKIRRQLAVIEPFLAPVLDQVGSPNREQIRAAIENGSIAKETFAGAFEKTSRTTIAVMRLREEPNA